MTKEEVNRCFDYLKSLGLKTAVVLADNDTRFHSEDTDFIQWIARYEYHNKRFNVIRAVEVEDHYPFCIVTYDAAAAETPYQLEVMVKHALELLNKARKARSELIKERKTKQIESAAGQWKR